MKNKRKYSRLFHKQQQLRDCIDFKYIYITLLRREIRIIISNICSKIFVQNCFVWTWRTSGIYMFNYAFYDWTPCVQV